MLGDSRTEEKQEIPGLVKFDDIMLLFNHIILQIPVAT